jgi:hypothetical protein
VAGERSRRGVAPRPYSDETILESVTGTSSNTTREGEEEARWVVTGRSRRATSSKPDSLLSVLR